MNQASPSRAARTLLRHATLLLIVPFALPAQQTAGKAEDRAAIQAIVQEAQAAWNRGDAKAFAAHFASDGSFTNIVGMQTYGLAPFVAQHERIFATIYKGSHSDLSIGTLRFIRPDVAIADVDATVSNPAKVLPGVVVDANGALHSKLQMVLSKEQGVWQIDAFHNVVVNPELAGPPKAGQ